MQRKKVQSSSKQGRKKSAETEVSFSVLSSDISTFVFLRVRHFEFLATFCEFFLNFNRFEVNFEEIFG